MKHLVMYIACFLIAAGVYAQNTPWPTYGNVGIGTTSPDEMLVITGNSAALKINAASNPNYYYTKIVTNWDSNQPTQIFSNGFEILRTVFVNPMKLSLMPNGGSVGIGTASPDFSLDVNGDARVGGAFRIGELYFSPLQTINLAIGTERWVKLATIPNNHYVRFQIRSGSQASEEIAEVRIFGTYFNDRVGISVERQTYNDHLREVRVVGNDGYPRTVFIKIRASEYAPTVVWRVLDSKGAITIHNVEETPSGDLSHIVAGNLVTSTNTSIVTTGNLAVGPTTPEAKLHVQNISSAGLLSDGLRVSRPNSSNCYAFVSYGGGATGEGGDTAYFGSVYAGGAKGRMVFRVSDGNANIDATTIDSTGNVGIGTTSPSEKLSVKGKIRAQEVIVETTGWSDHVFADSYKLQPLTEVEQHIKTEKHLPGVPSAQEVAEKGVSVGDMQAILLAKIEELTLHVIAQQKQLDAQRAEIATLKTGNAQIRH
ncbi:MAG: hypothetical protein QM715_20180 [Nibricoccus sp.]